MPDHGGRNIDKHVLPANLILADVAADHAADAIEPPPLPATDKWRLELADQVRRQLARAAQRDDLEAQLELADVRRHQRRVARGRRALRRGRQRHAGESGLDLPLDPLGLGDRAARPRRLLQQRERVAEVERICGGKPERPKLGDRPVAVVKWVDGTVLDTVWQVG